MNIKIYRIKKFEGQSATKAFIDLIVDDDIILKGFKLLEGRAGLFLGVPREKGKEGNYFDNIRFVKNKTKDEIEKLAIDTYNNLQQNNIPQENK